MVVVSIVMVVVAPSGGSSSDDRGDGSGDNESNSGGDIGSSGGNNAGGGDSDVLRLLGILFCGELALNSVTRLVLSILILLQLIKIKKEERVFNPGDFVLACC